MWSVPVRQHPDPRAVKTNNLEPRVPSIAEHKQRAALEILAQPFRHQSVQTVEAFAQVAGFHRHKYLQAPGKTQRMAWPAPAPPLMPKPLVFHRPFPARTPPGNAATPARCRSQPLAAIQQRPPIAVAEVAAPTVCRHDCVSPSWPGLNILIQSAAQTGEVPSPLRTNAVRMSRRCAFDTRSRPLVSAITGNFGNTAPMCPQEHYQNRSLLS